MISYWQKSSQIYNRIFIPKYYDPNIKKELELLGRTHDLMLIGDLVEQGILRVSTGDEIGKLAYGTGDIAFVRTSDISNWEIKSSPKQGVSEDIYDEYSKAQDVQIGDLLLVRDGTYLIGTNCIITELDTKILYQSHILKVRVIDKTILDPYLVFLCFNSKIVQRQIRNIQFTADTIDTIGNRWSEIILPIPKSRAKKQKLISQVKQSLEIREKGKAFIKQSPVLFETVLETNSIKPIESFLSSSWENIIAKLNHQTVTAEFGGFNTFWLRKKDIKDEILLPKYYDPNIVNELKRLEETCQCITIGDLMSSAKIECTTGDEIGKMAYGTGEIPFLRTSDFSNWEIKHDPKQGVSEDIYEEYRTKQDVKVNDILLVRDGTYLIGTSCMITETDKKVLFCGGLYKLRVVENHLLDSWLLMGLLNSFIVKRQFRTKQFTRDVIDTMGKRLFEVVLPIPKSSKTRQNISDQVKAIVTSRINAREKISKLSREIIES